MSELNPEHPSVEEESQTPGRISRLGAAATGFAWGLVTFEGGTALMHAVNNQDTAFKYTPQNQLFGIALFGIGGAIGFGRFVYREVNK